MGWVWVMLAPDKNVRIYFASVHFGGLTNGEELDEAKIV